jgi:hypothetical protein
MMLIWNRLHVNQFHLMIFIVWQFAIMFIMQEQFTVFHNYRPDVHCIDTKQLGDGNNILYKICTYLQSKLIILI